MKFASYVALGAASYGLLQDNGDILDLPKSSPGLPADLIGFIAAGESALDAARAAQAAMLPAAILKADTITLTAPIPRPAKNVFCVGRNYREHGFGSCQDCLHRSCAVLHLHCNTPNCFHAVS